MSDLQTTHKLTVLGAGLSGLTFLYYYLKRDDASGPIVIVEKSDKVGGVLTTVKQKNFTFENGAQGVLASRSNFANLVEELGLTERIIKPRKGLSRFLHLKTSNSSTHPTLVPLTLNPFRLITSKVFTLTGYLRLFLEFFIPRGNESLRNSETIYGFFKRRFGRQFAENLSIPMATGIWAGGAQEILLKHAFPSLYQLESEGGGILKGLCLRLLKKILGIQDKLTPDSKGLGRGLVSFQEGMQEVIDALKVKIEEIASTKGIELTWRLGASVTQVEEKNGIYTCEILDKGSKESSITSQCFVSSLRPDSVVKYKGKTLEPISGVLREFSNLKTHTIVTCCLGGKMMQAPAQGFGVLSSSGSQDWLGILFVHSLYPEHVPEGAFLYRVLLGGDRAPNFYQKSSEEIREIAKLRLEELGLVDSNVEWQIEFPKIWKKVIYLQNIQYDKLIEKLDRHLKVLTNFHLVGNYLKGVSVEDCIRHSKVTANEL